MTMTVAYHLVAEPWFRALSPDAPYLPEAFGTDGFVHLTHGREEVLAAGNRYYRADSRPYLLLTIDLDQLAAETRYDDPDRRFPHVYGPLERAAIIGVARVQRDAAGRFVNIGAQD